MAVILSYLYGLIIQSSCLKQEGFKNNKAIGGMSRSLPEMQTPPPEELKTNEEIVPIVPPITDNSSRQALPISTLTPPPENGCDEGSVLNQEQIQRCTDSGKKPFTFIK